MDTLDPTSMTPATKDCGCPAGPELSRRSFLKAAGVVGLVAGMASEGMFTRMAFADTPYDGDVLVVLSLRGGFDSLQAIVPTGDAHYATWRPNIVILEIVERQFQGIGARGPLDPPRRSMVR